MKGLKHSLQQSFEAIELKQVGIATEPRTSRTAPRQTTVRKRQPRTEVIKTRMKKRAKLKGMQYDKCPGPPQAFRAWFSASIKERSQRNSYWPFQIARWRQPTSHQRTWRLPQPWRRWTAVSFARNNPIPRQHVDIQGTQKHSSPFATAIFSNDEVDAQTTERTEDAQGVIYASVRRTDVQGTDKVRRLAILKTAHSPDREATFARTPPRHPVGAKNGPTGQPQKTRSWGPWNGILNPNKPSHHGWKSFGWPSAENGTQYPSFLTCWR